MLIAPNRGEISIGERNINNKPKKFHVMANTYTQLYIHVVFSVKYRRNHIHKTWQEELYKYISGVVSNHNQKLMIIGGMPDHVHILLGTRPNCNLSDLVRIIKANASKWINDKKKVNQNKI